MSFGGAQGGGGTAKRIRLSDGIVLDIGAVANGQALARSGTTVAGTGFEAAGAAAAAVAAHAADVDPHPQFKLNFFLGVDYFIRRGMMPTTKLIETSGAWPAFDASYSTGSTITFTDTVVAFANSGIQSNVVGGYNFAAAQKKVLIIVGGVQAYLGVPVLWTSNVVYAGADGVNSSYWSSSTRRDSNPALVKRVAAVDTVLASDLTFVTPTAGGASGNSPCATALLFDNDNNQVILFTRYTVGEWVQTLRYTVGPLEFTSMRSAGVWNISGATTGRFWTPLGIYGTAA